MDAKKLSPSLRAEKRKNLTAQGTSSVATIRHFFIDEPYRPTGIQDDLLAHAIQHVFKETDAVKEIKAITTSLMPYTQKCLRDAGFLLEKPLGKIGIYKWQIDQVVLQRTHWEQKSRS